MVLFWLAALATNSASFFSSMCLLICMSCSAGWSGLICWCARPLVSSGCSCWR